MGEITGEQGFGILLEILWGRKLKYKLLSQVIAITSLLMNEVVASCFITCLQTGLIGFPIMIVFNSDSTSSCIILSYYSTQICAFKLN